MHEFLRSIADGYFQSEGLNITSYTFVFPNSRSAKYFSNYLGEKKDFEGRNLRTLCLTMSELFEKGAKLKRASQNRLLMSVYAAYRKVSTELNPDFKPEEFDRFRFWAEMLIKDFDETDRYLVDPEQMFRNIGEYKEIQSYYLTEDQKSIIRDFWGDDPYWGRLYADNPESKDLPFWAHIGNKDGAPKRKFVQLWEMLLPIYRELHRMLLEKKLCYPGMACREVVKTLKSTGRLPFNPKKYVFIGFHRLTTAEHIVMDELQRLDMAHFYWDYDPVLMNPVTGNRAGRFIARYAEYFRASLPAVTFPSGGGKHAVEVIGVGSNVGQAKIASQLLTREDTAVVLPSDDMLLPLVASVPERFEKINVTMAYPMRFSQLAQVYSSLAMMQIRARRHSDGMIEFFRNDVMRVLANPLLRAVCVDELSAVKALMKEKNLYNLPAHEVTDRAEEFPIMSGLMSPVNNTRDMTDVAEYTCQVLTILKENAIVTGIDLAAIDTLRSQIDELRELSAELGIGMVDNTFFHMLERAVFQRGLPLSGITFDTLQIMGVLETRALGFKNVIMLSMNDSVFPGRFSAKSFIPESLRRAYGMPTVEHYEADNAYYFYHILSHADRLTLIYDSRSGGLRSGEKSRFIEQLLNVGFPGVEITCSDAVFSSSLAVQDSVPLIDVNTEIKKTERIMERLNRYLDHSTQENVKKYKLSASSLKTYLQCPFQFYLERVEDIHPADPPKENITELIIGNIIHDVAERLYKQLPGTIGKVIDRTVRNRIINNEYDGLLEREVRRAINANFVGIPRMIKDSDSGKLIHNTAVDTPLRGEAEVYEPIIRQLIIDMLLAEPETFSFIDGEMSETFSWKLKSGKEVNFTMKIDRLDRVGDILRIVDYKTGKEETGFNNDNIMARGTKSLRKGIFQLLTYCYAYISRYPKTDTNKLKPLIYTLKSIPKNGSFADLTYSKNANARTKIAVESYAQLLDLFEFESEFDKLIDEIFDPDKPFWRATDEKVCNYCNFKRFCFADSTEKK